MTDFWMTAKYCTCTTLDCWLAATTQQTNEQRCCGGAGKKTRRHICQWGVDIFIWTVTCVLCLECLKPSKVDTNAKLENGARCLHESGCGFSSATISAARSAGGMRCSNAFTQFSMLLEKSQHTWFGWAMQQQHGEGRGSHNSHQFQLIFPEGELENYPGQNQR